MNYGEFRPPVVPSLGFICSVKIFTTEMTDYTEELPDLLDIRSYLSRRLCKTLGTIPSARRTQQSHPYATIGTHRSCPLLAGHYPFWPTLLGAPWCLDWRPAASPLHPL